jgi:hypothetical protein
LLQRELEAAALMLYSGEGAKTGTTVDFANSDPRILKIFLRFLIDVCQVKKDRMRFYLYCFSDQNSKTLVEWWSRYLRVKGKYFTKPYVRKINSESRVRSMKYGVLHIRYSDKKLLEKILWLIDQTSEKLLK